MKTRIANYLACVAIFAASTASLCATEWRGLSLSGKVVKGGYDVWGGDADYSLLVRIQNNGSEPVKIRMHELYNSALNISFENLGDRKKIENKPGRTGDVVPKDLPAMQEAILIGPGVVVSVAIGLDGFVAFRPGRYKGRHIKYGMDIPEFEIGVHGEVIHKNSAKRPETTMPDGSPPDK